MMRRVLLMGVICCGLAGCLVTGDVPEDATVSGPGIVVEPPLYRGYWWGWPHYNVEHRYVVEDRPVVVEHHHYYPFYDRVHPPVSEIDKRRERPDDRRRDRD